MRCTLCGVILELIGSAGISDVDGRWSAETTRYRCARGHMLFVTDAAPIDEAEEAAAAGQCARRSR